MSRINLPFLRAHRRKGRAGGEAHQSNGVGHRTERGQLADIALNAEQAGKVDRRADVVEHGRAHDAGLTLREAHRVQSAARRADEHRGFNAGVGERA